VALINGLALCRAGKGNAERGGEGILLKKKTETLTIQLTSGKEALWRDGRQYEIKSDGTTV